MNVIVDCRTPIGNDRRSRSMAIHSSRRADIRREADLDGVNRDLSGRPTTTWTQRASSATGRHCSRIERPSIGTAILNIPACVPGQHDRCSYAIRDRTTLNSQYFIVLCFEARHSRQDSVMSNGATVQHLNMTSSENLTFRCFQTRRSGTHRIHPFRLRRPDREQHPAHQDSGRDGADDLPGVVRQLPLPRPREGQDGRIGVGADPGRVAKPSTTRGRSTSDIKRRASERGRHWTSSRFGTSHEASIFIAMDSKSRARSRRHRSSPTKRHPHSVRIIDRDFHG